MTDQCEQAAIEHVTTVPLSLAFLRGQACFLRAWGIELCAISSPGVQLGADSRQEHIDASAAPLGRRITPWRDLTPTWQLTRLLRHVRPMIVDAHSPKGDLLGIVNAWLARTPVRVYHRRGLPMMIATGRRRFILCWSQRVSLRLADGVICVSHSQRQVAFAGSIRPLEKFVVPGGGSGNGVDATGRFNPAFCGERVRSELREQLGIPSAMRVSSRSIKTKNRHGLGWLQVQYGEAAHRVTIRATNSARSGCVQQGERHGRQDTAACPRSNGTWMSRRSRFLIQRSHSSMPAGTARSPQAVRYFRRCWIIPSLAMDNSSVVDPGEISHDTIRHSL